MSDIYLEIKSPDIKGDVTDYKYKGRILVESLATGMSNPSSVSVGTQAGSAGWGGKVIMQDVTFTKLCDRASPMLWLCCTRGLHFTTFEFAYVVSRGDSSDWFKSIKLTDVLITGYSHTGSGADSTSLPRETVTLNFAKIELAYRSRLPKGGFADEMKFGYDLAKAQAM
jgi:type VI secretion system secreted protein Hcp